MFKRRDAYLDQPETGTTMRVRTSSGDSFTREIVERCTRGRFGDDAERRGASASRAGLVSSDLASGDTDEVAKLSPREAGALPAWP
jgi:hypothetical protein